MVVRLLGSKNVRATQLAKFDIAWLEKHYIYVVVAGWQSWLLAHAASMRAHLPTGTNPTQMKQQ